jgi:hypothetical protein
MIRRRQQVRYVGRLQGLWPVGAVEREGGVDLQPPSEPNSVILKMAA